MEIEDEVCRGLILRITPNQAKSFSVIYKVPGEGGISPHGRLLVSKQHRVTLGKTPPLRLMTARQQAQEILRSATEGRDPRVERRNKNVIRHSNTFETTFARFMAQEIKPSVRSWKTVDRVLRLHVLPAWRDKLTQEIRRSDVHELIDGLVAHNKTAIAREVRKHLSRFFNWAVDRDRQE